MHGIVDRLLPAVGGFAVTTLMRSTRSDIISGEDTEREYILAGKTALYVLWHGRLLPCAWRYRHRGLATLITQNRDGEYISRMIEKWGFAAIRGSTSRGGVGAIRQIVELLSSGVSVAVTPDGPRGPRQVMKGGPIKAAAAAGVPIIPVSAAATGARFFGRWDRFLVPTPFARCSFAMGEPTSVRSSSEVDIETARSKIERELNNLTNLVDEAVGENR